MAPAKLEKLRGATVIRPVVHSPEATRRLEASLRRLGADEATVDALTGRRQRRTGRWLLGT